MNNPLGVSPSKGNQGTTRGKEKSFDLGGNRTHDLRTRSTVTLPTELPGRTEKVGDDLDDESRRRESKGTPFVFIAYFLFAAIHHLNRPRLSLSDLVAQSAE